VRNTAAAMLVALAALAAGCGGGTTTATPTVRPTETGTFTVGTILTQPKVSTELEVPKACAQAMAAYHDALVKAGAGGFPPNEEALQRATIKSCTRDEWLEAVKPYTEGDFAIALVDPEKVLDAFCGSPRSMAPACS
jgi:hypothetical protein